MDQTSNPSSAEARRALARRVGRAIIARPHNPSNQPRHRAEKVLILKLMGLGFGLHFVGIAVLAILGAAVRLAWGLMRRGMPRARSRSGHKAAQDDGDFG